MPSEINVTISSNSINFPDNKTCKFDVRLPNKIVFDDDNYYVGIKRISIPNSWPLIGFDNQSFMEIKLHTGEDLSMVLPQATFQSMADLETVLNKSIKNMLASYVKRKKRNIDVEYETLEEIDVELEGSKQENSKAKDNLMISEIPGLEGHILPKDIPEAQPLIDKVETEEIMEYDYLPEKLTVYEIREILNDIGVKKYGQIVGPNLVKEDLSSKQKYEKYKWTGISPKFFGYKNELEFLESEHIKNPNNVNVYEGPQTTEEFVTDSGHHRIIDTMHLGQRAIAPSGFEQIIDQTQFRDSIDLKNDQKEAEIEQIHDHDVSLEDNEVDKTKNYDLPKEKVTKEEFQKWLKILEIDMNKKIKNEPPPPKKPKLDPMLFEQIKENGIKFIYLQEYGRFQLIYDEKYIQSVKLSPELAYVTGFAEKIIIHNGDIAKYVPDLKAGISHLVIYETTGLAENIIFCDKLASIFQVVTVDTQPGQYIEKFYDKPLFIKVQAKEVREMSFEIRTLFDKLVPFDHGIIILTLVFKKILSF